VEGNVVGDSGESSRDFAVADRCLIHYKTTCFNIECLQYYHSRGTYKTVPI
jgi:hypothetical protein